jgi:MFS family permease
MIVAVPMLLGLLWNKWAGGASGFLLGSIYALWYGIYGSMAQGWINNMSLLGYILSAMLIGYMSGALSQKSSKLSRLLFSGFVAGLSGGLFLFLTAQLSRYNFIPLYLAMLPRLIFGIVIPIAAWYALRHIEKQKLKNSAAPPVHT